MTKEEAKNKIAELVAKYKQLSLSEIKSYHEAKTKQGFVLPLFQYLGWDIFNTDEVAPEEKTSKGRVDYAFKLHGISQFYLEAKPLKADLNKPEYKEQVVTYAYNKGVTWAVLTDFQGMQLFNAQTGQRFLNLNHENYLTDFDKLWLLSRDSLQSGLLNKEAAKYGALPPAIPIEKRLYDQLRQWREELFTQLHHYNPELSFSQIDEVIQRFFNRLIFIRTCEDRGIEERVLLSAVHQWKTSGYKGELVEALREIFRQFDGFYDSDLFLLHPVDQVYIEGSTIEHIITGLYEIPGGLASYDFSIIDADVLGAVYEQYLGHVATIVKQRAKEEKAKRGLGLTPEPAIEITAKKQRRKEHGIYYTPKFVTNYIVKETIGRFLQERSYNEILNIKILDPACGSGSFLIRAYDELLSYHADNRGKSVAELDQWERLPFLTNNIFGIDLDIQAVEIARLNLLLRSLARRETLPSLANNIRQGNSLISGSEQKLKGYFGDNWQEKKPFNWKQEFKSIFAEGGFDVVIGNPPWVSLSGKHKSLDLSEQELQYLFDTFNINTYMPNLYEAFIRRALDLLREGGLFSFIVPDRLATNQQFIKLREYILGNFTIERLLFKYPFPGVIADTMIVVIRKVKPEDNIIEISDHASQKSTRISQSAFLSSSDFSLFFVGPEIAEIFQKVKNNKKVRSLGTIVKSTSGCGAKSSLLHKKRKERGEIRVMKGENIGRYEERGFFWFEFKDENLSGRTRDVEKLGAKEKVLIRKTGSDIIATFDDSGIYPEQSLYFLYGANRETLLYILALLNSKLLNVYYRNFAVTNRDATPQLKNVDLDKFPMIASPDRKIRDDMVTLADKMLEVKRELTVLPQFQAEQRQALEKEIEQIDKTIDNLVYKLYGITQDEIKIVESQLS